MNSEKNERKATQIDEGWRNVPTGPKATEVDAGWRGNFPQLGRMATQVDEGWRNQGSRGGHQATVVDEGWRNAAAEMLDPANLMNKATANHFATLGEFQEAVEKLPQLTSSTNQVYHVKRTISTSGGESIVLLCSDPDGKDVVAKLYYESVNRAGSSIAARTRVLE